MVIVVVETSRFIISIVLLMGVTAGTVATGANGHIVVSSDGFTAGTSDRCMSIIKLCHHSVVLNSLGKVRCSNRQKNGCDGYGYQQLKNGEAAVVTVYRKPVS